MSGPRGPRPLPTHLKLLRGNPSHRPLNKLEPQPSLPAKPPDAPAFLPELARAEWERVITELYRLRLVTLCDLAPLAAYCAAYARWRTASAKIEEMAGRDPILLGLIVKTQSGGAAPNPLVLIADRACRDMVRYASEFGLTPAARSRINAPENAGSGKFDGFLAS
jgi:P27 family predicted phage terminase small subunit